MKCKIFHTFVGLASASALSLTLISASPSAFAAGKGKKMTKRTMVSQENTKSATHVRLSVGKARIISLPLSVRDVLVANPGVADVIIRSPRKIFLMGRGVGSTNAFFFDLAGRKILQLEINVSQNGSLLEQSLKELVPNANITTTMIDGTVFLRGSVRSADIAENVRTVAARIAGGDANIVNLLDVLEDQQVLLQVKIAEVSRRTLKTLGVNIGALLQTGGWALNFATTGATAGFLNGRFNTPTYANGNFNAAFTALEQNGLVRTLAEPNLTAISGQRANFLAGGTFPSPTTNPTTGAVAVTQEAFGVELEFTPIVLNSGKISLRIRTEVSSRDASIGIIIPGGGLVPGRRVRRAQTTIELPSGGSMMLAGLIQQDDETNISGVPGLKDVPILGTLFRTNSIDRTERELVVIVTAVLVKPIERREQLLDPTIGLAPPSDYDLYGLGRIQRTYGRNGASVAKDIKGPIGYIVK